MALSVTRGRESHDPVMDAQARETDSNECLTVVCAWCGRELSHGTAVVSHGICSVCSERLVAEAKRLRSHSREATG